MSKLTVRKSFKFVWIGRIPEALVVGAACMLALVHLAWANPLFRIEQQKESDLIRVVASGSGLHKVEIDDAPGFHTPVMIRTFSGSSVEFHANDVGLIPGVGYHVRFDDGKDLQDLSLVPARFVEAEVTCETLRRTWEETGRRTTGEAFSGVRWDVGSTRWVLVPHNYLLGQSLYNAELFLRPALDAARGCNDLRTLDEIAQYYLLMLQQTETVGTLLGRPNLTSETRERLASTDRSARTFSAGFGDLAGEGELYNAQWLHPAAQLVRLISLLPIEQRTPAMKTFAIEYTRFIVKDQLHRYLIEQRLPAPGGGHAARIELWKLSMGGLKGARPWDTAMSDIDLWLLASAAEMLGANANDPKLAPLDAEQVTMLLSAVQTGVRFFQSKRTEYPATRDFTGKRVGSASYFNGDYAAHEDYDYSAITSKDFPASGHKQVLPTASWDISHTYRLPIFLRALYENRKATGSEFPQYRDLQLVVNQYVYRVFNGDYSRPLFHNYFDGSDGWFRVGFNGGEFGYPPSEYCDQHNPNRPCLLPGNIIAWGQLAFVNPDLARLEEALVSLALDGTPEARQFKDRYYFYSGTPYQVLGAGSHRTYAVALYFVVAANAERIADRPRAFAQATSH